MSLYLYFRCLNFTTLNLVSSEFIFKNFHNLMYRYNLKPVVIKKLLSFTNSLIQIRKKLLLIYRNKWYNDITINLLLHCNYSVSPIIEKRKENDYMTVDYIVWHWSKILTFVHPWSRIFKWTLFGRFKMTLRKTYI